MVGQMTWLRRAGVSLGATLSLVIGMVWLVPTLPASAAASPSSVVGTLGSGQSLLPGQALRAPKGPSELRMQRNGNAVLYYLPIKNRPLAGRKAPSSSCKTRYCGLVAPRQLWSSKTQSHPGARLTVRKNGEVVVTSGSTVLWSSHTAGHPGLELSLLDSGNLVARQPETAATHSAGTTTRAVSDVLTSTSGPGTTYAFATDTQTPVSIGDTLGSNQTLQPGQYLVSQNGSYEMDMSPWGTVIVWYMVASPCPMWFAPYWVEVDDPNPTYQWSTTPAENSTLTVQGDDGNVVLSSPSGAATWSTGTTGQPGDDLVLGNDGNLVVYSSSGAAVWSTSTNTVRGAMLCSGETLQDNQVLESWQVIGGQNGWRLQFANDGGQGSELDLVATSNSSVEHIWRSSSASPSTFLSMQTDGNLVIYPTSGNGASGTSYWASNTGSAGAWAKLYIEGGLLGVISDPVYNGPLRQGNAVVLPQTAILWCSSSTKDCVNNGVTTSDHQILGFTMNG